MSRADELAAKADEIAARYGAWPSRFYREAYRQMVLNADELDEKGKQTLKDIEQHMGAEWCMLVLDEKLV